MALPITITDAGRAEIINAQNTGTAPVTITEIGFGTGQYSPAATQTALQAEVKRVSTIAGEAVAADTIHVVAKDEGSDAYNVGEFGLFSDKGTLIAVYSQPAASGWIFQKAGASTLLLATDIILESLNATSITFGDVSFINPPATTSVQGVVELATPEETQAGTDGTRAVTPAGLKSLTASTSRPGLVQLNDTLTSSSAAQALTAAQGKKLQDEKQPKDDTLTALAALVTAANKLIYATGLDTFATTDLTPFARTLLDDLNASAALATLGAAPLDNPTFTGNPKAPTPASTDSDTSIATTAFVRSAMALFGVGATGLADIDSLDAVSAGGSYRFGINTVSRPSTINYGSVVAIVRSSSEQTQLAQSVNSDRCAIRYKVGGAWSAWQELWHTGNLVKQSSSTDTTAGALMAVGAFGLGASPPPAISDIDAIATTMFFFVSGGNANNPFGTSGASGLHMQESQIYGWQLLGVNEGDFALKGRIKTNGIWSAWIDLWTNGNLPVTAFAKTLLNDADAAAARATLDVYSKAEANGIAIGVGQTWQDVTGSRASGTTYTNTTGRPIQVSITFDPVGSGSHFTINGVDVLSSSDTGYYNVACIVPAGATYRLGSSGVAVNLKWTELR